MIKQGTFVSDISKQTFPMEERVSGKLVSPPILAIIQKEHPDFGAEQCLSISELTEYRGKYVSNYLLQEMGEVTSLEETVIQSLNKRTLLVNAVEDEIQPLSTGQRVADKVADFGGSWTFIISFGVFILIWIAANVYFLSDKGFDPYPFILLNLILSCLAALQAPVIMMSQNRQEEKDRDRAKKDYMINLKSELEIRMLHEKMDHLMLHQQQNLIEIQKVQIDMMKDILDRMKKE